MKTNNQRVDLWDLEPGDLIYQRVETQTGSTVSIMMGAVSAVADAPQGFYSLHVVWNTKDRGLVTEVLSGSVVPNVADLSRGGEIKTYTYAGHVDIEQLKSFGSFPEEVLLKPYVPEVATPFPFQPIYAEEESGVERFKPNKIVEWLCDNFPGGMNAVVVGCHEIATPEDWEQFYMLIGYSVSGFSGLSRVRDETVEAVDYMIEHGTSADQSRAASLQAKLDEVREGLAKVVPLLFPIHPDDLVQGGGY